MHLPEFKGWARPLRLIPSVHVILPHKGSKSVILSITMFTSPISLKQTYGMCSLLNIHRVLVIRELLSSLVKKL